MNYKLLFPTYRNRYRFIEKRLGEIAARSRPLKALNLGGGEGDYDAMIAGYCVEAISCDINEQDVAFGRQLNNDIPNLQYQVENALDLSFPDATFDLLISVEVLEHVGHPAKMMQEIGRVLRPGGNALITFPSLDFPITYDPVNRIASLFTKKKVISQGAYAFGHEYLIPPIAFREWARENDLEILEERNMSGYLVGLLEMYWTGLVQRIFKANASNLSGQDAAKGKLRPSRKAPALVFLTDMILAVDHFLFGKMHYSVGKGFVLQKRAK